MRTDCVLARADWSATILKNVMSFQCLFVAYVELFGIYCVNVIVFMLGS